MSQIAKTMGRIQYFRGKAGFWIELLRGWVVPAAAGGGLAKFLGLQSRWAVLVALLIPLIVEGAGLLLGRWLYRAGGIEADYRLAMEKDPYKTESLRLLAGILAELGGAAVPPDRPDRSIDPALGQPCSCGRKDHGYGGRAAR